MGKPRKAPLRSRIPLPESLGSALQKLKKVLNTITAITFCLFFVAVIGSELTFLATTPSVSSDIKTTAFFVGATAILMLIVHVIDITES